MWACRLKCFFLLSHCVQRNCENASILLLLFVSEAIWPKMSFWYVCGEQGRGEKRKLARKASLLILKRPPRTSGSALQAQIQDFSGHEESN
jgi:hypothetical protein